MTDPLGRVTTYTYDANGDLVSVTDPEGETTAYTYDSNHQMLTITDARGHVIMSSVLYLRSGDAADQRAGQDLDVQLRLSGRRRDRPARLRHAARLRRAVPGDAEDGLPGRGHGLYL